MELHEAERIDDLGRRGYRIIQNTQQFCFGIDAVLLAWFSRIGGTDRVIDLCSGNGIVPLLILARREEEDVLPQITGLEIQPEPVALAKRSCELNHVSEYINMVAGDVKTASAIFGKGVFDAVTVNPPYMKKGSGLVNPADTKAVARHEILCDLNDVVREAAALLKTGGKLFMVHRPGRLPEILEAFREYRLAPSRLCFVHPYCDREATMVLIEGIRGGRNTPVTEPPVIVYEKDHTYTQTIRDIYDDGRH